MTDYNTGVTSSLSTSISGALIPSAARTTALSDIVPDENIAEAKGIIVFLTVTAASGTGGLTLQVKALPPGVQTGGVLIGAASAAIIGTGVSALVIYPGAATSVSPYTVVNTPLPTRVSINVVVGDASSYTYSVSAFLLG